MENDIEQGSAIDIEKAKDILKKLNTEVRQYGSESHGSECCIYRVPNQLRNVNSKAYDPNLISIGPFHRENKGLEAMEKEKLKYFRKLTEKYGMDEKKMCDIVISIKNQEERLRNCYSEKSILMESSDDFVKMILLDAVFIILFFLESKDDSGPKILGPWMTVDLREDLILLENQLPLFIIQEIYGRVNPRSQYGKVMIPFLDLAKCHFGKYSFLKRVETSPGVEGSRHFTDLLRNLMLGGASDFRPRNQYWSEYSAVNLLKAGVRFDFTYTGLVNITFDHGVLTIPRLEVDHNFERRIRNIMALEQCCYSSDAHICSYMKLMDHLIDSAEDVGLLVRKGIIVHTLGDDAAVSNIINHLCEHIRDNIDESKRLQEREREAEIYRPAAGNYTRRYGRLISLSQPADDIESDIEQATDDSESDTEQATNDIEMAKDILKTLNTEVRWIPLQRNDSERYECCIYRVPNQLRNVNSKAYDPNLISIGPLHRENKGLEAMEKAKLNYFRKLTEHYGLGEKKMYDIVISIKNQEERLRNCYSEKSILMENSDDFVRMILLDAVFIILFFLETSKDGSDPKILEPWMTFGIREDLMLLENQVPLFIIKEIYDRVGPGIQDTEAIPFLHVATCHFKKESFLKRVETAGDFVEGSRHFTDLLRKLMLGGAIEQCDFSSSSLYPVDSKTHFTDLPRKLKTTFTDLLRKMMLGKEQASVSKVGKEQASASKVGKEQASASKVGKEQASASKVSKEQSEQRAGISEQSERSEQRAGISEQSEQREQSRQKKTYDSIESDYSGLGFGASSSDDEAHLPKRGELKSSKIKAQVLPTRVLKYGAVMLLKAGVRFEASEDKCLVNIQFHKGVLKIPLLEVDHNFECRIRNIMALEQCCYSSQAYICGYMKLMDHLIDSAEDVGLLVRKGIIVHRLCDDAAVSSMINNLCENIGYNNALFGRISRGLNSHCDNPWNHRKATLKLVYFPNIWRGTATVAAAILLILTFIQAVCSVKSVL